MLSFLFKLLITKEFHGNTVLPLFSEFLLLYHYLLFKHMTHTHRYTLIQYVVHMFWVIQTLFIVYELCIQRLIGRTRHSHMHNTF